MKNNILYYPHSVNSDEHPKFKMLRVKYGWAGEGKFWALNNRIAESENCELNLTKKYNKASIANDLDFTLEEFDEFLEYLTEDCDLIIKENNHITTEIVGNILSKLMKERIRNKENYDKRVIQDVNKGKTQSKHVESKIQHVESIQSKVKKSKVKKSKEVYSQRFEIIYKEYPNRDSKKKAKEHFIASVKTDKDWQDINTALVKYKKHLTVEDWLRPKSASTWFFNWRDWIDYIEPVKPSKPQQTQGEIYGGNKQRDKYEGVGEVVNIQPKV